MLGASTFDQMPCLLVALINIALKNRILDTPLPAATDLDCGELTRADKSAHLSGGDVEILSYICDGQEFRHSGIFARPTRAGKVIHKAVDTLGGPVGRPVNMVK